MSIYDSLFILQPSLWEAAALDIFIDPIRRDSPLKPCKTFQQHFLASSSSSFSLVLPTDTQNLIL